MAKRPGISALGAALDKAFPLGTTVDDPMPPKAITPSDSIHSDLYTSTPVDGSTPQQVNKSTSEPVHVSTGIDVDTSASQPVNTPTRKPVVRLTSVPVDQYTSEQVDTSTSQHVERSTSLPVKMSTPQQVDQYTSTHVDRSTSEQVYTNTSQPVNLYHRSASRHVDQSLMLSAIQLDILTEMANNPDRRTSYRLLASIAYVPIATARDAVTRLARKGFVGDFATIRERIINGFQGFSYRVNEQLCNQVLGVEGYAITPPSASRPVDSLRAFSSSSLEASTTTTKQPVDMSTGQHSDPQTCFVLTGPEMGYWQEVGLSEGQVLAWVKEFEVDADYLRQQLAWARYDLIYNGKEEGVDKVVSWMYGALKRSACCYAMPANYKTPSEVRAENLKQQIAKDVAAKKEILDLQFQQIYNNPEGAEYVRLLNKLSELERSWKGKALEAALRTQYFEELVS